MKRRTEVETLDVGRLTYDASHVSRPTSAFTLVELLVACALMALVSGAVVATIAGGLRVWERLQVFGTHDQAIEIALHQIRSDLRSAHRFEPIPFTGRYDTFTFATAVEMHQGERSWQEVGQTTYVLDRRHHQLRRAQQSYRTLRRTRPSDVGRVVLDHVERLQVRYYQRDASSETYRWQGSCASAEPPLAVQVELGCRRPGARELTTRSLRVFIPAAPGVEAEAAAESGEG